VRRRYLLGGQNCHGAGKHYLPNLKPKFTDAPDDYKDKNSQEDNDRNHKLGTRGPTPGKSAACMKYGPGGLCFVEKEANQHIQEIYITITEYW
jgi:hypothetical protein